MIRSTTVSLKFTKIGKRNTINNIIDEYKNVVDQFITLLWDLEKIPALLPKTITSNIDTWLSARMIQCAGKQASGIVRGTKKKQDKRKFVVDKLISEGKHKKARKLQRIIDETSVSKPSLSNICPELDNRFVKIDLESDTIFDGWVTLSSIGNKTKLQIPFYRTKHFNKLYNYGTIKNGIRISKDKITFMFDVPDVEKKSEGKTVGIDIGQTTTISCSNGHLSMKNNHGHDLATISDIISRKKKGSKAFIRTQSHRKNYINWAINQLNLDDVSIVKIEKIKNMRKCKNFGRRLSHWTYADIFSKLESKCEENGVQILRISPTYTSKRCSACGWTRRANRKGKMFRCTSCGFTIDADLNASRNICANIRPIGYNKRHLQDIKTGFWWKEDGDESVVHLVK